MTDDIKKLKELLDKATPGECVVIGSAIYVRTGPEDVAYLCELSSPRGTEQRDNDAKFLAAARNALPSLLSSLEEARAEAGKLREALERIAAQKKSTELDTEYDVDCADFEAGYDYCIDCARQALEVTK